MFAAAGHWVPTHEGVLSSLFFNEGYTPSRELFLSKSLVNFLLYLLYNVAAA